MISITMRHAIHSFLFWFVTRLALLFRQSGTAPSCGFLPPSSEYRISQGEANTSTELEPIAGRASPHWGPAAEALVGSGASSEVESFFVHFHTKEGPKVQDLNDSSPLCLRQTASRSHDQLLLLVSGESHVGSTGYHA